MADGFDWDEEKRAANREKHGVDFAAIDGFDWGAAFTREDERGPYGEARFVSVGPVGARLYVAVWTAREGRVRLISLRKANGREKKLYDEKIESED
jgi:hypothetical protein